MNIFLTDDIHVEQYDADNFERYEYTRKKLNPADYKSFNGKPEEFEEWAENNLEHDELYNIPMMNALRYFPSFVTFNGDEETAPNTCLVYDNNEEAWAVAMTGGGMDLSPYLLDTFVMLGKGVPSELAKNLDCQWCKQQLGETRWDEVVDGLAEAFREYADRFYSKATDVKRT